MQRSRIDGRRADGQDVAALRLDEIAPKRAGVLNRAADQHMIGQLLLIAASGRRGAAKRRRACRRWLIDQRRRRLRFKADLVAAGATAARLHKIVAVFRQMNVAQQC